VQGTGLILALSESPDLVRRLAERKGLVTRRGSEGQSGAVLLLRMAWKRLSR
jgi:hypothetical protein